MDATRPPGRWLLTALAIPPAAWVVHLLGQYLLLAVFCANRLAGLRIALGVITLACVAACAGGGVLSLRLWRRGQAELRHDAEPGGPGMWDARMGERGARASFLAVLALFMAGLFLLVIVFQALPAVMTPACSPSTIP